MRAVNHCGFGYSHNSLCLVNGSQNTRFSVNGQGEEAQINITSLLICNRLYSDNWVIAYTSGEVTSLYTPEIKCAWHKCIEKSSLQAFICFPANLKWTFSPFFNFPSFKTSAFVLTLDSIKKICQ